MVSQLGSQRIKGKTGMSPCSDITRTCEELVQMIPFDERSIVVEPFRIRPQGGSHQAQTSTWGRVAHKMLLALFTFMDGADAVHTYERSCITTTLMSLLIHEGRGPMVPRSMMACAFVVVCKRTGSHVDGRVSIVPTTQSGGSQFHSIETLSDLVRSHGMAPELATYLAPLLMHEHTRLALVWLVIHVSVEGVSTPRGIPVIINRRAVGEKVANIGVMWNSYRVCIFCKGGEEETRSDDLVPCETCMMAWQCDHHIHETDMGVREWGSHDCSTFSELVTETLARIGCD